MNVWLIALFVLGALALAFAGLFVLARRLDNYGIVDIAWSYAFGAVALSAASLAAGWSTRRWLLAALVLVWSARLGTHLYRRVMGHHPKEDRRYAEMRRQWSGNFGARMFRFFQIQALSVVVLSLPFFLSMRNTEPHLHLLEMAGGVLWLFGMLGEAVADAQLAAFKRKSRDADAVCDVGLWRYSRHPNYFFEWLVWVGYFVFASASPWGWLSILSPAAMLYLLLRVTGIPMTEEQAVKSKGDAYRRYQESTSAFFPWAPRTMPRSGTAATRP